MAEDARLESTNSPPGELATCDIAIVGGGMVGLTLALLLAKALPQLSIQLHEVFPDLAPEADKDDLIDRRSTALSDSSATILKKLGLWSALAPFVTPIDTVHISDTGHAGMSSFSAAEGGHENLGYVIENTGFGEQLLHHASAYNNLLIQSPSKVLRVRPLKSGAELDVLGAGCEKDSNEESKLRTRLVIIADGANSPLRQALGIDSDVVDYHQHAVIANVEFQKAHRGVAYERFRENGPLALLPLGRSAKAKVSALVWTTPEAEVDEAMSWSDEKLLSELQKAFGFRLGHFLSVGKRQSYPLKRILAKEQVRSSLVIVGNAAHFLHPVAGQGFNLALRDSARLVEVVVDTERRGDSIGDLASLQRYIEQQKSDQWVTTELSDGFNRLFSTGKFSAQATRNIGLLGLELVGPLKKAFFEQMMGRGASQARSH